MVVSPRLVVGGSSVPGGLVEIVGVVSGSEAGLLGAAVPFRLHVPPEFSALPIGPGVGAVPVKLPGLLAEVVPGADDVAQSITAPGVVGSDASGTGARLVSVAPGRVAAENGLGPFSGDEITAPGVVGKPIAVVPMVETCARPDRQPSIDSISATTSLDITVLTSPAPAV
ncbi:MAG: hypothetical protein ABWY82_11425 [Tardiphaga sp.]